MPKPDSVATARLVIPPSINAEATCPNSVTLGGSVHNFSDLRAVFAAATPLRSGDALAGIAATSMEERMAARYVLADLPLRHLLNEVLVPYEVDEVTRLIVDTHDAAAFSPVAAMTIGDFRDWLLGDASTPGGSTITGTRSHPGDGGRGVQTDAQPGSDQCRAQMRSRDRVSYNAGAARAIGSAPTAESSH